ncbi:MAG: CocE/NonD family hydrolase [Bacteroidia bacterium]
MDKLCNRVNKPNNFCITGLNFLLFMLLFGIKLDAQKIYFPKRNYADSIIPQNAVRDLALNTLDYYKKSPINEKTNDNLFRLYLCAGRYAEVDNLLRQLNFRQTHDSSAIGPIAFQYQVYNATLQKNTIAEQFTTDYSRCFKEKYAALSQEWQADAEFVFYQNVDELKNKFENIKNEFQQSDSLSIDEAIALCRSFLSYTCYSKTQHLAQVLIKEIERELYFINDTVMVSIPDGGTVQLTVVRSKKDTAPQAVALMYSIYTGNEVSLCKSAVAKGYVGIIASTRGKRESKDTLFPCERDARDAYHIIDWISKQPWCNGKVGMYGGSYLGFSQWSAVKYPHPALKTIVPQVAVAPGIDYPVQNGVAMNYMLRWLNFVGNSKYGDETGLGSNTYWDSIYGTWYQKGLPFRLLDSVKVQEIIYSSVGSIIPHTTLIGKARHHKKRNLLKLISRF